MAATPFNPPRSKRLAAIRDVVYEYVNLISAGYYSLDGKAPWRTNCDDAFLLGCRKLHDFLMRRERFKRKGGEELEDVLALDYLPRNFVPNWNLPIWILEWRDPMDKQLAHITYSRDKVWEHMIWVPKLMVEFRDAWLDFRECIVNDEYRSEFDKQMAERKARREFEDIVSRL